jgi:hypothetical protein
MQTKKIGLLLGDENDWPTAIEHLIKQLGTIRYKGSDHTIDVDRIRIHPFNLRQATRYNLVIDRLAWWHYQPREWLKKVALMNGVYLLNNPFTFQSMEKHSAYCAMLRLGLNIPETWLIPSKTGPDTEKFRVTAERYHDLFNLEGIADQIGYPLYMKPFDGGGWRGVSRSDNPDQLREAYDDSGQSLMHLQAGLENYDVFVRSLAIGPQVTSLSYDPAEPMHNRYQIEHDFLSAEKGREARIITKTINAFFRWDFNSCEAILKDDTLWAIDFANACPDIAVTSLHYYFPWAIKSLLAWSIYSVVSERRMRMAISDIDDYFEIADSDRSYAEKLDSYEALADAHFERETFEAFSKEQLPDLDAVVLDYFQSQPFDDMLIETVRSTFPDLEHDKFISHYRGLLTHWADSQRD